MVCTAKHDHPAGQRTTFGIMWVTFGHLRPSGHIMLIMRVIEARCYGPWRLTITSISNMSEHCVHDLGLRYPDRTPVVIPAIVLADQSAWAGGRRCRGDLWGPREVHRRSATGQSPPALAAEGASPNARATGPPAFAAILAIIAGRQAMGSPGRENCRPCPPLRRTVGVMFAPCLLGCRGTSRQHPASSVTVTCVIADDPVVNGMESTELIAEQRTLNPGVTANL